MSFYKCPRCGYLAKQRTDLRRHFLRKKACPNKYEDITIEECFKTILFEEKPSDNQMTTLRKNSDNQMTTFLSVNDNSDNQMTTFSKPSISSYECLYCNKKFRHRNSKNVHMKKCKNREFFEIKQKIKLLEMENEDLKKEKSVTHTNINNINNINNNVQHNHITINAFGKENLDYVSREFIQRIVKEGPYGSIQKLIKHIHFNPNHMENQNIKIPNKRDKFGMVFNGEKWLMKNKQNMITEIAGNAYDLITDHCEDLNNKKYDKFCLEFENKQLDCIKRIITDTELLILNCQK